MSYAQRIDELIGSQIADYLWEISVTREPVITTDTLDLPHGYPNRVYSPMPMRKTPAHKNFLKPSARALSNRVPRVLGLLLNEGYPLGVYNATTR